MNFERIDSRVEWSGRIATVRTDTVRYEDGEEAEREVVEHPGAVGVVAHDGETLFLVRQPREPVGDPALLELPAGKLDEEGEHPLDTAKRELAEEIGKGARSWRHLTSFYTSPGFADEECHLYLATDLYDEPAETAEDERIEIVELPLSDLDHVIAECRDAKTLVGLLWLRAYALWTDAFLAASRDGAARPNRRGDGHNRAARFRAPLRAPGARLPRLPRVRARAVAQHARGLPLRPAAVRALPRRATRCPPSTPRRAT